MLKKLLLLLVSLLFIFCLVTMGYLYKISTKSLLTKQQKPIEFIVNHGDGLISVGNKLNELGIFTDKISLFILDKITQGNIKFGFYQINNSDNILSFLNKLKQGKVLLKKFTIVEGTRLRDLLENLKQNYDIKSTLKNEKQLVKFFNSPSNNMEGLFLADTYLYSPGTKDVEILKQAYSRLEIVLQQEWMSRNKNLALKNPYEALIMASIIEKETADPAERPLISGVFNNRLKKGMRLQTDPTVIYGLTNYDGNLRKKDLLTPTPYNTYTNKGLPPTPIALVGTQAIKASMQPELTNYLYFVAKHDGSRQHIFSTNLNDHNKAVYKYQIIGRKNKK